jgi:integral membrane sensor domain MASE1
VRITERDVWSGVLAMCWGMLVGLCVGSALAQLLGCAHALPPEPAIIETSSCHAVASAPALYQPEAP